MEIWVEEAFKNFVDHCTDINRWGIPCLDHQVHGVDQDYLCEMTSWLVQDKIKVIFAQERVGRVRGSGIVEDFVLIMGINHFPRCARQSGSGSF